MKILIIEEVQALSFFAKGCKSSLRTMLEKLEIGEALTLNKSNWSGKQAPNYVVNYFTKISGRNFSQGRLADNKGWVFVSAG